MEKSAVDPLLGTVLREYRLVKRIGEGGMGAVYAATHVRLGRQAAVKVLLPEHTGDRKLLRRFFAEARVVAELQHPNVVEVLDLGEDGVPCIVMELLRGSPLDALLASEGPRAIDESIGIVAQALTALEVVHARSVVHRDLKPANLFLADGPLGRVVKILDFGIAKLGDGAAFGVSETRAGTLIGTPHYMAPEQIEGHPVDARTDLYAVGIILHELLCGAPPFAAVTTITALFHHHLAIVPAPPSSSRSDVPVALDAFVARCLAKAPADRFASAADARRALVSGGAFAVRSAPSPRRAAAPRAVSDTSTLRGSVGELEALPATLRRWPTAAVGAGVSVLALALGAILLSRGHPPAASPAPAAAAPAVTTVPSAAPPACTVRVTSAPPGAAVLVGDRRLGLTPLAIDTACAPTAVVLQHDGYEDYRGSVSREPEVRIELARRAAPTQPVPLAAKPDAPARAPHPEHPLVPRKPTSTTSNDILDR